MVCPKLSEINEDVLREGFRVRTDQQVETSTIVYANGKDSNWSRFSRIVHIMGISILGRNQVPVIGR